MRETATGSTNKYRAARLLLAHMDMYRYHSQKANCKMRLVAIHGEAHPVMMASGCVSRAQQICANTTNGAIIRLKHILSTINAYQGRHLGINTTLYYK